MLRERGWSSFTVVVGGVIRGNVEVKYIDTCQYLGAGVR